MNGKLAGNLFLSLIVTALGAMSSSFYTLSDRIALSFGQAAGAAGLYISIFAAGCCLSALVSGSLGDWIGKRRVMFCSLGVMALGLATAALSASQLALMTGLFFIGVGFGPSESLSSALLTDVNPDCPTRWMNISQIGYGIGAIGAPVAVVWYITGVSDSYRGIFWLFAAIFVVFSGVMLKGARLSPARTKFDKAQLNIFSVLKNRTMVVYVLMVFFYLGYESMGSSYLKQYFMSLGETEPFSAAMISLFWASMIICRLIGAFLNDKEVVSIRAFTSIMIAGLALMLFAPVRWLRIAGVIMYGGGCGPVWPMLFALAVRLFPQRSGAACGIMMLASTAGNSVFPTVIGVWPNNLAVTLACCIALGVLVLLGAFRLGRTDQSAPGIVIE